MSGKGRPTGRPTPSAVAMAIIDRVNDADRAWFAAHPGARSYERQVVLGEFWPVGVWIGGRVRVLQLEPGVRLRQPIGGER